jgi:hypothetical protein
MFPKLCPVQSRSTPRKKDTRLLLLMRVLRLTNPRRRRRKKGRAVAQAVSRWLPTTAARVRVRAAYGVCGGQSGIGVGFLRVLWFPLSIIPPISLLSKSPGAGTIGLLVAAVPNGPNWTPPPHYTIFFLKNPGTDKHITRNWSAEEYMQEICVYSEIQTIPILAYFICVFTRILRRVTS